MALSVYNPPSDRIVHETEADFVDRRLLSTPVHIVQRDKSLPIIAVSVTKNGQPFAIPANAAGNVCWKKPRPDPHFVYNPCLGVNQARTVVYFEVTSQMTTTHGSVHATLEITISSNIASSAPLPIFVDKNPVDEGEIDSTDEAKTLLDYVARAEDAATQAKGSETAASGSATKAATSEKNAKDSETAAGKSATNAKTSETEAGKSATNAKNSETAAAGSAADAKKSADTAKEYSGNPPMISRDGVTPSEDGTWWIWNASEKKYKDTGFPARGLTGPVGPKGDTGPRGVSVKNFVMTDGDHSPGTTDTYTLTLDDDTEYTLLVYNGRDGLGTGDMEATVYDPQKKKTDVFKYIDDAIKALSDELRESHSVSDALLDSSGDPLLDNAGEELEGRIVFADAGDITNLELRVSVLEALVANLIKG